MSSRFLALLALMIAIALWVPALLVISCLLVASAALYDIGWRWRRWWRR